MSFEMYSYLTGEKLRRGYTTGTCAAAATRGAALCLIGRDPEGIVNIKTLAGPVLKINVKIIERFEDSVLCAVIKDAGDDPDVTNGIEIRARVELLTYPEICIAGGRGVGTVTKEGLAAKVGEPAINPGPREQIKEALGDLISKDRGFKTTISVPRGEEVAKKTMNSRLGILGGISILGTTGIVEPMSEEGFKDSLLPQLDMETKKGADKIILTPGRFGQKSAEKHFGTNNSSIALMSNFVGFMLKACSEKGFKEVILWGHFGKLVKLAGGIFNTHSKVADGRLEIIAAHAALLGAGKEDVKNILEAPTAEAVLTILDKRLQKILWPRLVHLAALRSEEHVNGSLKVRVVFLNLKGEPIADSEK